jgi:hypothetical protein
MSKRETHCRKSFPSSVLNGTRSMCEYFVFSTGSSSTLHFVPLESGISLVSCSTIISISFSALQMILQEWLGSCCNKLYHKNFWCYMQTLLLDPLQKLLFHGPDLVQDVDDLLHIKHAFRVWKPDRSTMFLLFDNIDTWPPVSGKPRTFSWPK